MATFITNDIVKKRHVSRTVKRQTVNEVVDFSSQYGSDLSRSYTVANVVGETNIYPKYGDFTQSLVFRTYGRWWSSCPSSLKSFKQYHQSDFLSQDFIDIRYSYSVYPTKIEIFETYNPGAVVRILACDSETKYIPPRWILLWAGSPRKCAAKARVFSPVLKKCPFKTRRLRLEFNQEHCDYFTEIDAVYLHGVESEIEYNYSEEKEDSIVSMTEAFHQRMSMNSNLNNENSYVRNDSVNISMLPIEVFNKILSYLRFSEFGNLSKTCRFFRDCCYDPMYFKEFNLQPYWFKVNGVSLQYLTQRCRSTEKLCMSWCGSDGLFTTQDFERFLKNMNSGTLRCLYLSCCRFLDASILKVIVEVCPDLEELDLSSCIHLPSAAFENLAMLKNLKRLNLYRTQVTEKDLAIIVESCPKLKYINLGGCYQFGNYDEAMTHLQYCPNIFSLDLWRSKSITANGIISIINHCPNLEEIDLGWCKNVASHGIIRHLVTHCQKIKKIFLTAVRTLTDDDLLAISENCSLLEQLDILGNSNVSKESAERVLMECTNLKFFDVSFCSKLDSVWYHEMKARFPLVDLKKSVSH
ncbi:F-box/LRR-repeat protein 4-like [Xenia sp. Carnegie-2017]|uniref:F-box/LRR-repeat protein 4-like n=1 Tax=Xenia sp. Carnegie-2017 TaxID=2897299 RepID=UPI001F0382C7|nr:F-box/LRR-repeat protein 4-like [Xenia sp. Carnegie-2017]